jgi:hypothetical protein
MISSLYKGIIVAVETPAIAKVWIPSKQAAPIGQFEYLGDNMGGNLDMDLIRKTAIRCRIMTPLSSGAWWSLLPDNLSVPGNPTKLEIPENTSIPYFNINLKAQALTHTLPSYNPISSNPSLTLTPVSPILGQTGGIQPPSSGGIPPGDFPQVKPNQHVLVAFVNSSLPIILGTLPTDLEFEATIG